MFPGKGGTVHCQSGGQGLVPCEKALVRLCLLPMAKSLKSVKSTCKINPSRHLSRPRNLTPLGCYEGCYKDTG